MFTHARRLRQLAVLLALLSGLLPLAGAQSDLEAARAAFEREDYAAAYALYSPVAQRGTPEAQYRMGLMHKFGWGTARDHAVAARWFTAAAEQSHALAQSELGIYYKDGRGVERNLEQAATWFRKAAEQGVGIAQLNLGRFYLAGTGVSKDPYAAYLWLTAAARNNYMDGLALRAPAAQALSEEQIKEAEARAGQYRSKSQ